MKTTNVSYHKVFNLENYSNEKIQVDLQLEEGDNPQEAINKARDFVENQHQLNKQKLRYLQACAGKKVFVCSMSDLFQEGVPFEFIASVFAEIKVTPDTTYQILTKRPQRALEFYNWVQNNIQTVAQSFPVISFIKVGSFFPPQNVWIGTSVENQATANKRIPYLIEIPASVRFLSCEPLLGEIDIKYYLLPSFKEFMEGSKKPRIDWIIAGGESGHGAEPTHPNWVRSLRDQCASANVPFLFKQWGAWLPTEKIDGNLITHLTPGKGFSKKKFIRFGFPTVVFRKVGKSKAGNLLDGVQHLNFPL